MHLHDPGLLRTLMRRRGLLQKDLAAALTLLDGTQPTQQWVSSLLAGRHATSEQVAAQVAARVGVDVDHLFAPGRARVASSNHSGRKNEDTTPTRRRVSRNGTAPAGGRLGPELRGEQ